MSNSPIVACPAAIGGQRFDARRGRARQAAVERGDGVAAPQRDLHHGTPDVVGAAHDQYVHRRPSQRASWNLRSIIRRTGPHDDSRSGS
ncbi:hypothetical protein AB0L44_46300, partial [Nonomuraea wenchangensis]|uniref:hypothetical protein n=1 Tax=Nonomuraea wenchangensis TaxID=568860 RepID=UPI00344AE94F